MNVRFIILAMLFSGFFPAIGAEEPEDIYTALDRLHSALTTWAESEDSARAATPYWLVDTPFGKYAVETTVTDSGKYYLIENPLYYDLLTTRLEFFVPDSGLRALIPEFLSRVSFIGKQIRYDDSLTVIYDGEGDAPETMRQMFEQRLNIYRSLGFVYPPENPTADLEATLCFHAKEVDSLFYDSWDHFLLTLRNLCYGTAVYAGPLAVSGSDSNFVLEFYLCIPFPEASAHHFLTIREEFDFSDQFQKSHIVVHFTPYVRLDNIKEMFGRDQGDFPPSDQIPLKIND